MTTKHKIIQGIDNDSTDRADLKLFQELGLKPFKDISTHKRHYVGVVRFEGDSTVEIYVTPCPAEFWGFEVHCGENGKSYKVTTGSGSLSDFWPSVKLIAENMLVVEMK